MPDEDHFVKGIGRGWYRPFRCARNSADDETLLREMLRSAAKDLRALRPVDEPLAMALKVCGDYAQLGNFDRMLQQRCADARFAPSAKMERLAWLRAVAEAIARPGADVAGLFAGHLAAISAERQCLAPGRDQIMVGRHHDAEQQQAWEARIKAGLRQRMSPAGKQLADPSHPKPTAPRSPRRKEAFTLDRLDQPLARAETAS